MARQPTTNANTGVALPPPPQDVPLWTPVLPDTDVATALSPYGELGLLWGPRSSGFDGNRTAEGVEAEAFAVGYASSQIDLPVNLIARTPPGRSLAIDGFREAVDMMDQELLTLPPDQHGGSPAYMRVSDDLMLLERELDAGGRWLIGAP